MVKKVKNTKKEKPIKYNPLVNFQKNSRKRIRCLRNGNQ